MGKLYVVGIGPGAYEEMTVRAVETLKKCDMIIGYTLYVDLVQPYFKEKEFLATPMRQEEARCQLALQKAGQGKDTALICSGDAGVYGMAGLICEMAKDYPEVSIEIVPGVTAALGGAALLGAPLIHDFCLISLSDLLTPWEKIEKRLLAAAEADFVICIYNPSSKNRKEYLKRACDLLLTVKREDTVCGLTRQIAREEESFRILTLKELKETGTDMFTTVFIGNEDTKAVEGKMVTPRGYSLERE